MIPGATTFDNAETCDQEPLRLPQAKLLCCSAIWLGLALAETLKTLFFAHNKSLILLYLAQSLYLFLPCLCFSVLIGLLVLRSPLKWRDAESLRLHLGVATVLGSLHILIVSSANWVFLPWLVTDVRFVDLFMARAVTWAPYELLCYFALLCIWQLNFSAEPSYRESGAGRQEPNLGQHMYLNTSIGGIHVTTDRIEWLMADNNHTVMLAHGQQLRVRDSLRNLLQRLSEASAGKQFIQTHRSAAVNRQWIRAVERNRIVMQSGKRIPVSRRRYRSVLEGFWANKFTS